MRSGRNSLNETRQLFILRNLIFSFLLISPLALSLSSCPGDDSLHCQTHADCANDQVCREGTCRLTCNHTRECASGLECFDGACVPPRNSADSGQTDVARADGGAEDRNITTDSSVDSGSSDLGHGDSSLTDTTQVDGSTSDGSPRLDGQSSDSPAYDSAIPDASSPDNYVDPCETYNCPSNMECQSSGGNPQCFCGSVACADGENCVYPETAYATGIAPICCAASEHNCNSHCVDFASNSNNCGDCNQACDFGETCTTGSCDCGGNGPCSTNFECCDGTCVDVLNDSDNCGEPGNGAGCAHACNGTQPCTEGACGCSIGTDCGTGDWTCPSGNCVCSGVICDGVCFADGDCCSDGECSTTDVCTNWGACDYQNTCTEAAQQSRSCPEMSCTNHNCVETWSDKFQDCSRDTDGTSCSSTTVDGCGSCTGFANTCDESGTQTCDQHVFGCAGGICDETITQISQACTRDTDGTSCSSTFVDGCGSCTGFANTCDETGTQTCDQHVFGCAGGICDETITQISQACTRDTDGTSCSSTFVDGCGSCTGFADTCDESGTQTCDQHVFDCAGGICDETITHISQACSRPSTDGIRCYEGQWSGWSACGGFDSNDPCDETGTQSRTRPYMECAASQCDDQNVLTERASQSCTGPSTDGVACSETTCGDWTSCSYSNTCDESGSRKKTCTHLECATGICDDLNPVSALETDTSNFCDRDTENDSCGTSLICCSESCISSNSDDHCGTCANACLTPDWFCDNNTCQLSCFPAGTPVRMADGSSKAIQDIVPGDQVMTYDFVNKAPMGTYVLYRLDHPAGSNMILLNDELKVTYEHLFYANGQWIEARNLHVGDVLLRYDQDSGNTVEERVRSVEDIDELPPTYNLELAHHHYYFAGDILVHNEKIQNDRSNSLF